MTSSLTSKRGVPLRRMTRNEKLKLGAMAAIVLGSFAANKAGVSDYAVLPIACIGLLWVANFLGFATDQLSGHTTPGVTGLVQSTIGNAPEAFSVYFLLTAGLTTLALTSLIGSVVVNGLLMLGIVYGIGSLRQGGVMKFNPRLGNDTVKVTGLVVMVILFIAVAEHSGYMSNKQGDNLSLGAAAIIFLVYITMLWVHAKLEKRKRGQDDPQRESNETLPESTLSFKATMALMLIGGIGAAVGAETVVGTLEPVMNALKLPEDFVGFVFVAIIGNASENLGAFRMVRAGNNDTAVSMIKHSVVQVAAGLFPLMIMVSWLVGHHLSFTMPLVFLVALALTPICIMLTSSDGEAEPHEAALLVALYLIMGVTFLIV